MTKFSSLTLAAAIALSGCASTGILETPAQAVFAAKSAYDVALTGAVTYRNLPACGTPRVLPCHDPAILAQVRKADNVAAASLDAAEAAVRTPQIGTTARDRAIAAAKAALAALTSLVSTLGVSR